MAPVATAVLNKGGGIASRARNGYRKPRLTEGESAHLTQCSHDPVVCRFGVQHNRHHDHGIYWCLDDALSIKTLCPPKQTST